MILQSDQEGNDSVYGKYDVNAFRSCIQILAVYVSVVNFSPLPPKILSCGEEIYGYPLEDLFRFISFHVPT